MNGLTKKQQDWLYIVRDWQASGLNQAEYCRCHDIDLKRFYSWKHVLEKKGYVDSRLHRSEFLPVKIVSREAHSATVSMNVSGVDIQFYYDTDPTLLIELLNVLRGSHDQAQQ